MKRYAILFVAALVFAFACSDDEKPKKGTLKVDGKSYPLHQLFGQATLGSDHSHFQFIIANDKLKVDGDDDPTGKGINVISLAFSSDEVTEEPVTGSFIYNDDEEIYEIDNVVVGLKLNTNDEDEGTFYEDFDVVSATISKSGSTYTIAVVAEIDDIEITASYKGKIKMLPTEDEEEFRRAGSDCSVPRWM